MLDSVVCRQAHFETDWYREWETRLDIGPKGGQPTYHRKPWEFAAVAQTLRERGKLHAGMRGLGFAVGTEPLPALFAAHDVEVVATDLAPSDLRKTDWARTNQHSDSTADLYRPDIVDPERFKKLVRFEYADMNGKWPWPEGSFDFVWSCCAFEHTGSLEKGVRFVLRSSKLLKPGGIGVHTTEYNCSSNDKTVRKGEAVIYRRRDIEDLDRRLRIENRACLAKPDFWPGDGEHDRNYDTPPYFTSGKQHIKFDFWHHVCTSMLLTVIN
ncbi:MAG TPA: class I SAM-dependent methyltransferase [Candidatus Baltobacteraceae bacterium]